MIETLEFSELMQHSDDADGDDDGGGGDAGVHDAHDASSCAPTEIHIGVHADQKRKAVC